MGKPSFRRFAFLVLFGVPMLALAALVILDVTANAWSEAVDRAWAESVGTMDELIERFPEEQANSTALSLEDHAVALGIDLAPRAFDDRSRPERNEARSLKRIKAMLRNYLEAQIQRSHRQIDPPQPALAEFLENHAGELTTIRRALLEGEVPRWEVQLAELGSAALPNLLGHMDLQKLLMVDALVHAERGADELALADMEASWRLNVCLRDDPWLISQLVAISVARLQAGTLRQLVRAPAHWIDRLDEHDFRDTLLTGFEVEGRSHYHLDDYLIGDDSWLTAVPAAVAGPYTKLCVTQVSSEWRGHLVNLRNIDYLCDRDLSRFEANFKLSVPAWNVLGKMMVPDMSDVLDRLARLELDLELTRRVLMLRAAAAGAPLGTDVARSAACPKDGWEYSQANDGSFEIRFPRAVARSAPKRRVVLPLSFTEPAPDTRLPLPLPLGLPQ